jgi:hypothetical protein
MTDSDKDTGNQPKQWSPEDWRLLVITFVGGLASIIVGAGALGLAVALARVEHPGNNVFSWVVFVAFPIGLLVCILPFARERNKSWYYYVLIVLFGAGVTLSILVWIGAAAGIK